MDDENGGLGGVALALGIIGIGLLTLQGAKPLGIVLCVAAVVLGIVSL